jgi:hypothetical protein
MFGGRLAGFEVIMAGRFWGDHRGIVKVDNICRSRITFGTQQRFFRVARDSA